MMPTAFKSSLTLASTALFGLGVRVAAQRPAPASWSAVQSAMRQPGAMQPQNVIKFSFPRTDLAVSVGGVALKPAFALGSWVAFEHTEGGQDMAMGDLVLTEGEVAPVMRALQAAGVNQTALHNHLLGETPRVMYMHVAARGNGAQIARGIRTALAQSRTPLVPGRPVAAPPAVSLDTAALARALGVPGKLNGTVFQASVARREAISDMGYAVPASMGVATSINFQPIGGGKAAITGDFVLLGAEVNPVIRALTSHGITVTAVHSHMIDEQPRLFFMHYWATGDAVALARGLRAALDQTNSNTRRPGSR